MHSLLFRLNLLHPLWHGAGDWPPSPFRLFQAMVAGAFGGRWAAEDEETRDQRSAAFCWLERQQPPEIAAPPRSQCRQITSYVPNNDLDAVGGDPRRVKEIPAEKVIRSVRLESSQTFLYAWHFETGEAEAMLLCELVERLHTFGRGVDPAWARGEVMERESAEEVLAAHSVVARPSVNSDGNLLRCPDEGSLRSLVERHRATTTRLSRDSSSKKTLFRQPPMPHYRRVGYERASVRLLFEIRRSDDLNRFVPVAQVKASLLTTTVRDEATKRLSNATEKYATLAERFVSGRDAGAADLDRRVRIVPLPTIGHPQASPSIRRVVVEVPPECPLNRQDVEWAFLGLMLPNEAGSAPAAPAMLVPALSEDMLRYYGFGREFRRWRSVTPVALPAAHGRPRTGGERFISETEATSAVVNAVRHAGLDTVVASVRMQREPFHAKGAPADAFESSRFAGKLRHVEVAFQSPVRGPLVIGDGRFVGLGLMRPVLDRPPGVHVFRLTPGIAASGWTGVARALRRAVMARAQPLYARKPLPMFFHGHENDGSPARSGNHKHLFFAGWSSEGGSDVDRVAVIAPGLCDHSIHGREHWDDLSQAVDGLQVLRCGRDGVLTLSPTPVQSDDVYLGCGRAWTSVTGYRLTRHPKRNQHFGSFVEADVRAECARRGFSVPESVEVLGTCAGSQDGLSVRVTINFGGSLCGPVLLGRGSHMGDGLFRLAEVEECCG